MNFFDTLLGRPSPSAHDRNNNGSSPSASSRYGGGVGGGVGVGGGGGGGSGWNSPHHNSSSPSSQGAWEQAAADFLERQMSGAAVDAAISGLAAAAAATAGGSSSGVGSSANPNQGAPPPASERAIKKIPTIQVTPQDLVDENNRDCCICLEENRLHDRVMRLPCAHIFHPSCIREWLTKHCTCPVCRYELETTDMAYEQGRKARMASRKPRFARHELERLPTNELLNLLRNGGTSGGPSRQRSGGVFGCSDAGAPPPPPPPTTTTTTKIPTATSGMERTQLIDFLIQSNKIDVVEAPPPVEYQLTTLQSYSVKQLKQAMEHAGVFFDPRDVIEKGDMIQIFIASGRLVLIPTPTPTTAKPPSRSSSWAAAGPASASASEPIHNGDNGRTHSREMCKDEDDDDEEDGKMPAAKPAASAAPAVGRRSSRKMPPPPPPPLILVETVDEEESVDSRTVAARRDQQLQTPSPHTDVIDMFGDRDHVLREPCSNSSSSSTRKNKTFSFPPKKVFGGAAAASASGEESRSQPVDVKKGLHSTATHSGGGGTNATTTTASRSASLPSPSYEQFQNKSIAELKSIASRYNIEFPSNYYLERSEMVEALVRGGASAMLEPHEFDQWSVSALRACANEVGVDLSLCRSHQQMVMELVGNAWLDPKSHTYMESLMPIMSLSVPQLRAVARQWQVSVQDCVEKEEMIQRLVTTAGLRRRRK